MPATKKVILLARGLCYGCIMSRALDLAQRTRHSLLERVKAGDEDGWEEFYHTYAKLIRSAAAHAGLTAADQADVVQETMRHLYRSLPDYDRRRGSFRSFLFRATTWKIVDQCRQRLPVGAERPLHGTLSPAAQMPDAWFQDWERHWELEWKAFLSRRAQEKVRCTAPAAQYQIYDLHVVKNRSVAEVARLLGVSSARVRTASSQTLRRVRAEVKRLEQQLS